MANDQIKWINHAGFELASNGVRIVVDPWISGRAFVDGWSHISPTRYRPGDFLGVNYIWLSHEHPDHFSPADLKAISPDIRSQITVLFQKTLDHRVADFCRKLGFRVIELMPKQRTPLSSDIFITIGTVNDDSWAYIETPNATYLNMNDCVHPKQEAFYRSVAKTVGPVDVLLTQFSYANWAGNPGELERMAGAARRKMEQVGEQVATFKPKHLIPFASYVWFCAPENFHLNSGVNRIGDVYSAFQGQVDTVVLYPGDTWDVGGSHDSARAIEKYLGDAKLHTAPDQLDENPVSTAELLDLATAFQRKIRSRNMLWTLGPLYWAGLIRPVTLHATDTALTYRYDMRFGLSEAGSQTPDVAMSSRCISELFRAGYSADSIFISGRFRELRSGGFKQLSRNFFALRYNERGISVPWGILHPSFIARRFLAPS